MHRQVLLVVPRQREALQPGQPPHALVYEVRESAASLPTLGARERAGSRSRSSGQTEVQAQAQNQASWLRANQARESTCVVREQAVL